MSFGNAWGFGADEQESHRILGEFAEAGGNFIDTTNKDHEGQSEQIVGSFLLSRRGPRTKPQLTPPLCRAGR
jgi:aryl-alcohol dehydrogenase-like predicted oxidoreductase